MQAAPIDTGEEVDVVESSPVGDLLATLDRSSDGVKLWDSRTGRAVRVLRAGGELAAFTFSPDGVLLATGADDGTVRLWNPATGAPIRAPFRRDGSVDDLAFTPDGKVLAGAGPLAGSEDVHLDGDVSAPMAFSPDGKLLAIGGADHAVELWNPATGRPVGSRMLGHTQYLTALAFTPDSRTPLSGDNAGELRIWDVALYTDPVGSLCAKAGGLSRADWSTYAPGEPYRQICP